MMALHADQKDYPTTKQLHYKRHCDEVNFRQNVFSIDYGEYKCVGQAFA